MSPSSRRKRVALWCGGSVVALLLVLLIIGALAPKPSTTSTTSSTSAAAASASASSPATEVAASAALESETAGTAGTEAPTSDTVPGTKASTAAFVPRTPSDRVMVAALDDVNAYWSQVYPSLYGSAWKPISGGIYAYTSSSALPPCPGVASYADVAENAFYCPAADLVAWDAERLVPSLDERFGDFTLGIVVAHEMGHAVQARSSFRGTFTVTQEQQADCFAGAWTASVANGYSKRFTVTSTDLDAAVAGFLQLRDHPGTDGYEKGAHGSAFDRIGSFQDGYEKGAEACKGYSDQNVAERLVQLPFGSTADEARGGNLPFDAVLPTVSADLESFWSAVFSQGGKTWTPIDAGPRTDGVMARRLYDDIGDFAAATLLARTYAREVQARLGEGGTPLQQSLQADCLTGSWAASIFLADRSDAALKMSPGDLDKAVMALLVSGDSADDVQAGIGTVGTPFARITSLRTGFMEGISACAKITSGAS